eukprot:1487350-Prorocentrum_lima.AAC.1
MDTTHKPGVRTAEDLQDEGRKVVRRTTPSPTPHVSARVAEWEQRGALQASGADPIASARSSQADAFGSARERDTRPVPPLSLVEQQTPVANAGNDSPETFASTLTS